jgi:hypothetical protein
MDTGYVCKECGMPVSVLSDGAIQRSCGHHKATVTMNLAVVCTGRGRFAESDGLLGFLRRLGAAMRSRFHARV